MADLAFSDLYSQVLPYLSGAEIPIVDSQIRKAVREWMKRTTMYRETFTVVTLPGISDYKLLPADPTTRQVCSIIAVYAQGNNNNPLRVVTEDRRPLVDPTEPTGWFSQLPDVVTLYPQPDAPYTFTVNAVLTLTQSATVMPEELIKQFGESLAAGVLSAMMDMPGKPWTQSQAARGYGRIFSGAIRTERGKLRDGGQPNQSTFQSIAKFGV